MYLLDTNIISELRRLRPHGAVVAWLQQNEKRPPHLFPVTFGEIQAGVELTRARDPAKAAEIDAWADRIASTWNVLPMDASIFRIWARLMSGKTDDISQDAMIAATAQLHSLTVVTRNVRDFMNLGV